MSLLAPVLGAEVTCQTMLPVVIKAAKDRYKLPFFF
jgi:serine/threonine-protein phosphatase 2A regulatory subunit A